MEGKKDLANEFGLKRDFKGIWIPKEVWLDKSLSLEDRISIITKEFLSNNQTQ